MMGNPMVLGRLVWRAASLGLLSMVLAAAGAAIAIRLDAVDGRLVDAQALWRLVILVPGAIAVGLSLISTEARHTQFAWTLPRLRDGLYAGKLVAMALAAGLVAWTAIVNVPGTAAAALGLGALCFALGGVAADPLSSKIESRGVLFVLVLLVLRPDQLDRIASAQPVVAGLIGALLAVLLLRREFAVDRARERPFIAAMPVGDTTESTRRAYWARAKASDGAWSRPLAHARMSDWLLAANYETFGARSGGFLLRVLIQFVFIGSFAYYLGTPTMVAYIPAVVLAWTGFQLQGRFLYPVSRGTRAELLFWGSLLEIVATFSFAAVTLGVLYLVGPRHGVMPDDSVGGALRLAFFIYALAPIGHWGRVGHPLVSEQFASLRHTVVAFAMMAVWITAAILSNEFGEGLAPAPLGALIAALSLTSYTVYWFALRWYYARRDIVFTPA
ncbi:MAG TPA: hypothetical protein VMM17_04575 [Gemmatimonadaceae bacterium]|nr:hypothetical protein [Gemmatimonadaceae bacterium]